MWLNLQPNLNKFHFHFNIFKILQLFFLIFLPSTCLQLILFCFITMYIYFYLNYACTVYHKVSIFTSARGKAITYLYLKLKSSKILQKKLIKYFGLFYYLFFKKHHFHIVIATHRMSLYCHKIFILHPYLLNSISFIVNEYQAMQYPAQNNPC